VNYPCLLSRWCGFLEAGASCFYDVVRLRLTACRGFLDKRDLQRQKPNLLTPQGSQSPQAFFRSEPLLTSSTRVPRRSTRRYNPGRFQTHTMDTNVHGPTVAYPSSLHTVNTPLSSLQGQLPQHDIHVSAHDV